MFSTLFRRLTFASVMAMVGILLLSFSAFAASSQQLGRTHRAPVAYAFTTLDDQADPTFNQLLGINDHGVIAGYFGSGLSGHPNKGYTLVPPYGQGNYINENFPGSA